MLATQGDKCPSYVSAANVCDQCGSALISHTINSKCVKPRPKPTIQKKRQPRKTPEKLRSLAVRAEIKIDMLAAIPGVSRAKAGAILARFPTFAAMVAAPSDLIASVLCKNGKRLGTELGVAVWRALH